MTEKTLNKNQEDMLYTLRAEFRLEKSVETALYNFLVDEQGGVLSNQEFLEVLRVFDNWATSQNTPAFAVGEYYADDVFIYKVRKVNANSLNVDYLNKQTGDFVKNAHWSMWIPTPNQATAEQIATFKRAEHFAAKGRKWSEFKKGDKVLNNNTGRIGIVESVDEDGDAVVNYNSEGPLSIRDYKCTGALYLDIIQTAEELQEAGENESNC